jgi:hypothetical protein
VARATPRRENRAVEVWNFIVVVLTSVGAGDEPEGREEREGKRRTDRTQTKPARLGGV